MKRTIASGLVGMVLALNGCSRYLSPEEEKRLNDSNQLVNGTVVSEKYQGPSFIGVDVYSEKGIFSQAYSNPTTSLGDSIYNLTVETDEGNTVILNVLDGEVPKETIDILINEGDKIEFRKGNLVKNVYISNEQNKRGWATLGSFSEESGFYEEGVTQFLSRRSEHIRKLY